MKALSEKHRPADWREVIAQDKATKILARFEANQSLSGRAYWISGKSGTGKTSIARIIASKVSDTLHTIEMDAQAVTVATVARWGEDSYYRPMTGCGRCYIVNEAHGLRRDAVRALLVYLEDMPDYTTVVFTTTLDGQMNFEETQIDSSPLLSRCIDLQLTQRGINKAFAAHVRDIAMAEGLDGLPVERYLRLANENQGNMRAMFHAVEAGRMLVS